MNRIKELREQHGIYQNDLAEFLRVANNTVSSWERGRTEPDFESLKKMARLFECSIDYILGGEQTPVIYKNVTDSEADLLRAFHSLNPAGQSELWHYLSYLQSRPDYRAGDNTVSVG